MIANNYSNLYQCKYYSEMVEFYKKTNNKKDLLDFEQSFSLANVLYTESKKCVAFRHPNEEYGSMSIIGESEVIKAILRQGLDGYSMLRLIESKDNEINSSETLTSLEAAVDVCNHTLSKMSTEELFESVNAGRKSK